MVNPCQPPEEILMKKERYLLKLEPGLMARIRKQAEEEDRTIISIIVEALHLYYRRRDAELQVY